MAWKAFSNLCERKDHKIREQEIEIRKLHESLKVAEQRYNYVLGLEITPQLTGDKTGEKTGDKEDSDSDSSIEFDDNFQRVDTSMSHNQVEYPSVTSQVRDATPRQESPTFPPMSPTLTRKIIDENVRLKSAKESIKQSWKKDNAIGTDTISKLFQDVITLKQQLQETVSKEEVNDLKEKIGQLERETEQDKVEKENLKGDNEALKQQMLTFQEDFEVERQMRESAVDKFQSLLHKFNNKEVETKALQEKNHSLQREYEQLRLQLQSISQMAYGVTPQGLMQSHGFHGYVPVAEMRAGPGMEYVRHQSAKHLQLHHLHPGLPRLVLTDSPGAYPESNEQTALRSPPVRSPPPPTTRSPPNRSPPPSTRSPMTSPGSSPKAPSSPAASPSPVRGPAAETGAGVEDERFICRRCEKVLASAEAFKIHEEKCLF